METKKNQGIAVYECPEVVVMNLQMETMVCGSPGSGENEGIIDEELIP